MSINFGHTLRSVVDLAVSQDLASLAESFRALAGYGHGLTAQDLVSLSATLAFHASHMRRLEAFRDQIVRDAIEDDAQRRMAQSAIAQRATAYADNILPFAPRHFTDGGAPPC